MNQQLPTGDPAPLTAARGAASWLRESGGESLKAGRWFWRDFVMRYRARLIWVTSLGLVAAALQSGALLLLHRAFQAEVAGGALIVPILGWTLAAPTFALGVAAALVAALGGAAVLGLAATRSVVDLRRRYQVAAINALLAAVERACARGALDETTATSAPVRAALRQSVRIGAFARVAAQSIQPALRLVAFSAVAVIINPLVTWLLLGVVLLAGGLAALLLGRRGARSAREQIAMSRPAFREIDEHLAAAAARRFEPIDADRPDEQSSFVRHMDLIGHRFLRMEEARFVTATATVALLAVVIVVAGYGDLWQVGYRSAILTYLLALALAFREMVNVATSVAGFGRFYPSLRQHMMTLDAIERARSPEQFRRRMAAIGAPREIAAEDEEELV